MTSYRNKNIRSHLLVLKVNFFISVKVEKYDGKKETPRLRL